MRNPITILEEVAALIDAQADTDERRYNFVFRAGLRAAAGLVRDHAAALKVEMDTEEAQARCGCVELNAVRSELADARARERAAMASGDTASQLEALGDVARLQMELERLQRVTRTSREACAEDTARTAAAVARAAEPGKPETSL